MIFFTFIKELLHITENNHIEKNNKEEIIENILNDPNSKIGIKLNFIILFLIIISIWLIIFESIWDNSIKYSKLLYISDWIISTIFAIEYIYRFIMTKKKIQFSFKIMNIIDLLAFLPFFIELLFWSLINMSYLKALRILRIFRIFKLLRHFKSISYIFKWIQNYKSEYQVWVILIIIVVLLSSILMYNIEWNVNEWFKTIPDAMRWSIVTIATIWYWDTFPITTFWKIIWSMVILIWPLVIAMISSITVLVFFEVAQKNKENKLSSKFLLCERCNTIEYDLNSNYCRKCSKKFTKDKLKNNN